MRLLDYAQPRECFYFPAAVTSHGDVQACFTWAGLKPEADLADLREFKDRVGSMLGCTCRRAGGAVSLEQVGKR
jgi:hypothetical protein